MAENGTTAFCAEEYDNKIKQTLPYYEEYYVQILEIVIASGKKKPSWLDVGCGTGKMYDVAKAKIELGKFVFCDISPEMLQIARRRFPDSGNLFWEKSVLELECSLKYDVITAVQVNHYFMENDRIKSIQNCFHALKEGGYFFTFENFAPHSEEGRKLILQSWGNYQLRQGRGMETVEKHLSRYGTEYYPITVEKQVQVLKNCGFRVVELIWLSCMQAGILGIK